MKINTNSNTYTIVYAVVVVVIVAFLLAFASSSLQSRSEANERIDKKQQILAALNIRNVPKTEVEQTYREIVEADEVTNLQGDVVNKGLDKDEAGFQIAAKSMTDNNLPVYVCKVEGKTKYVVPMRGKGLWGPIWGFIALDADGNTVYGAYFSHDSETAGLGALIKEEKFQDQFIGKHAYKDGVPALSVMKAGQAKDAEYQCDGITGATLTSVGVHNMIREYLKKYENYFSKTTSK